MKTLLAAASFSAVAILSLPAMAETLRLHVERGAITEITDKKGGTLMVHLTDPSAREFSEFTSRHVGKEIQVLVDGEVVDRAIIREVIIGGQVPVRKPMSAAEQQEAVAKLINGAMILELRTSDSQ